MWASRSIRSTSGAQLFGFSCRWGHRFSDATAFRLGSKCFEFGVRVLKVSFKDFLSSSPDVDFLVL